MDLIIRSVNNAWNKTSNWFKYLLSGSHVFHYLSNTPAQSRSPHGLMNAYLKSSPLFQWFFKWLYIPENSTVAHYKETFNKGEKMALFLKNIGHFNEGTYNQAVQRYEWEQDELIALLTDLNSTGVLTEDNCRLVATEGLVKWAQETIRFLKEAESFDAVNLKRVFEHPSSRGLAVAMAGLHKMGILNEALITEIIAHPNSAKVIFILLHTNDVDNALTEADVRSVLDHRNLQRVTDLLSLSLKSRPYSSPIFTQDMLIALIRQPNILDEHVQLAKKIDTQDRLTAEYIRFIIGQTPESIVAITSFLTTADRINFEYGYYLRTLMEPDNQALLNPELAHLICDHFPPRVINNEWYRFAEAARSEEPQVAISQLITELRASATALAPRARRAQPELTEQAPARAAGPVAFFAAAPDEHQESQSALLALPPQTAALDY